MFSALPLWSFFPIDLKDRTLGVSRFWLHRLNSTAKNYGIWKYVQIANPSNSYPELIIVLKYLSSAVFIWIRLVQGSFPIDKLLQSTWKDRHPKLTSFQESLDHSYLSMIFYLIIMFYYYEYLHEKDWWKSALKFYLFNCI